jgi:hypothetical protein
MATRFNDGLNDTRIPVNTVEPGDFSKADVEAGKVSLVRFGDGTVRGPFAGPLLESALRIGGWKVDAAGKPETKPTTIRPTVNGHVAPRETPIHFLP